MGDHIELPQGTLELLILKTLALEPRHGWAISERLHQISSATLRVRQGSIYPALHRLERRGWIKADWGASNNNRRAKYYSLTKRGRAQLDADIASWRKLAAAIARQRGRRLEEIGGRRWYPSALFGAASIVEVDRDDLRRT